MKSPKLIFSSFIKSTPNGRFIVQLAARINKENLMLYPDWHSTEYGPGLEEFELGDLFFVPGSHYIPDMYTVTFRTNSEYSKEELKLSAESLCVRVKFVLSLERVLDDV